jgi:hypothetical protein
MNRLIFILFTAFSIPLQAQLPAGNRQMGMVLEMAQNNNFDSATVRGLQLCMDYTHFVSNWATCETAPGQFNGVGMSFLDIINVYYPAWGVKVELSIPVLNTVAREVPADLDTVRFNSPVMISRFRTYLDTLFAHIPAVELVMLSIGNEGDVLFANDPQLMADFQIFYDSSARYARQRYQQLYNRPLKIGTTLTWSGLTSPSLSAPLAQLNLLSDVIAVTYYPLTGNFQMRAPNSPLADFAALTAIYNDTARPVWFVECGYSSSDSCGSSYQAQADFYDYVFQAWDAHAAVIRGISPFLLHEWSQPVVDTLAVYYGLANNVSFKEYLRTLGIRTYAGNGVNKPAYEVIRCNVNARNFCATGCVLGVDETPQNELQAQPNPASEFVTFTLPPQAVLKTVKVYSLSGQLVSVWAEPQTATPASFSVAELPAGVWLCRLQMTDGSVYTSRVVTSPR